MGASWSHEAELPVKIASVVINLYHRTDRWIEFQHEMQKLQIEVQHIPATKWNPGWEGCTKSHIRALQYLMVQPIDFGLVFEDDFSLVDPRWKQRVAIFWQTYPQANVLMLAVNPYHVSPPLSGVSEIQWALSSSAYMIRHSYIPTLIQNMQDSLLHKKPLDVYWRQLQQDGTWYGFQPAIGKQRKSYSDIEKRMTNYGV